MTHSNDDLHNEILKQGASSATIFLILSQLKTQKRHSEVIGHCIRALEIFPDDIALRKLLAETYLETGRISMAEMEMKRVTTQMNELATAYKVLADIYRRQGRTAEAVDALKVFLAVQPDNEEGKQWLQQYQPGEGPSPEQGRPQAVEHLQGAEESDVDMPDIATPTLAEVYFKQGQTEEAIKIYERVVAQSPEDEQSANRLEQLKRISGDGELPSETEPQMKSQEGKEKLINVLETWKKNIGKGTAS